MLDSTPGTIHRKAAPEKTREHDLLALAHGPELVDLASRSAPGRRAGRRARSGTSRRVISSQAMADEDHDDGHAQHHPLREADLLADLALDVAGDDGVRRAAQQGAEPADGGGPRDREDAAPRRRAAPRGRDDVADRRAVPSCPASSASVRRLRRRPRRRCAGCCRPRAPARESAIGSIIRVVAVLETHIDRNAVEIIIPRMIRRGEVPTRRSVSSAIRRCRFHFCIAMAMRKPPRKRKTMGSA